MLFLDIVSWVVVGLLFGAGWAYFASSKGVRLSGALISGVIGALLGGFIFTGAGVHGRYNLTALVASIIGAFVVPFIYSTLFFKKPPQQPAQPTGSA